MPYEYNNICVVNVLKKKGKHYILTNNAVIAMCHNVKEQHMRINTLE